MPAEPERAYPCTRCGACCRVVHLVPGWPTRADGACAMLTEDNLCSIYEDRPDICRVGHTRDANVSLDEHFAEAAEACRALQEAIGLGEEFRVVLTPSGSSR